MTVTAMQLDLFTRLPVRGERAQVMEKDDSAREPRRMSMRSIMAHDRREDEFGGRKRLIMDCLKLRRRPLTAREILADLFPGSDDLNRVRPRISEMVKSGDLVEAYEQVDAATGETVAAFWLGR
jgi:hypothetical protein